MKNQIRFATVLCAICAGFMLVGCANFTPPPESAADDDGPSRCEALAMIDDVQDGDDQILIQQGRGGFIYSFADEFGSKIKPDVDGSFVPVRGGVDGGFSYRFKGKLAKASDPYAGMGFSFLEPEGPFDASSYKGISFIAKRGKNSIGTIRVQIPDVNTESEAGVCKECFNDFGIGLQLTEEWTRYEVSFDDLKQLGGWGDPRPMHVDVKQLYGIKFQVSGSEAAFDIWIDDVTFIGGCDK